MPDQRLASEAFGDRRQELLTGLEDHRRHPRSEADQAV